MAKKLVVPIAADPALFKRGLKESETAAKKFESQIKESTHHVRNEILGMGAAFIGVGGFIEGVKKSVEAAVELDAATSQMTAQMKANGESAKDYTSRIAEMNLQLEKVGFTNTQSEEAFARLSRAAGDSGNALKYMGLTADLAASKHVSLAAAALVVGKVIQGSTSALNRYGIIIPKGTSATEALAIAQGKVAGQAKAMAKPTEVFSTIITDLEARIGKALLPTIDKYMTKIENWIGQAKNQKTITDAVKTTLKDLGDIIEALKLTFDKIFPVLQKVRDMFGSWKPLIVAAGAALVALGLLSPWTALALGAVFVITHWKQVKSWFADFWGWMKTGWKDAVDVIKGIFYGWVAAELLVLKALADGAAKALGWLPGIGGKLKAAADKVDSWYAEFKKKSQDSFGDIGKSSANSFANSYISTLTKQQAAMAAAAGGTGSASSAAADARRQGGRTSGVNTMSASQVSALVRQAGGTAAEANYLSAISGKESGRNPSIINDNLKTHDYSVGLFQINFRDMQNQWMRGGKPAAAALQKDPLAQAKYALGLLHSQGPSAWSTNTPAIQALLSGGGGVAGASHTALPGDLKAQQAADAAATKAADKAKRAQEVAANKAASAAKAAASAAYRSWKENYFTPLDNQYKSDTLITDESARLNKLEALHAKLAIDLKKAKGQEHQDILMEEDKVQGKIQSIRQKMASEETALGLKQAAAQKALMAKQAADQAAALAKQHAAYVKGLQSDLSAAQSALSRQQALFDRAFSKIAAGITGSFNDATQAGLAAISGKYSAATPEEQARDAFQAQLDAAHRAADLATANDDLIAAQLAGDPAAIQQAQAKLGDIQNQQKLQDLQDAADKSRVIANAAADQEKTDYQNARDEQLSNLNAWLDDQKSALADGTETWDQFWQGAFSDAPEKYAPDAVGSLQGIIDQQNEILRLQALIDGASSSSTASDPNGFGGKGIVSLPGGIKVPAGLLGKGFGGGFAKGGVVPGALGQPMLILAHGGETVIPNGGHGGGSTFVFNFPHYMGDTREIIDVVQREFLRLQSRGSKLGFAT